MNTTELLNLFIKGETLSVEQLKQLKVELSEIEVCLSGKGDFFKPTLVFVQSYTCRVSECLKANTITLKDNQILIEGEVFTRISGNWFDVNGIHVDGRIIHNKV